MVRGACRDDGRRRADEQVEGPAGLGPHTQPELTTPRAGSFLMRVLWSSGTSPFAARVSSHLLPEAQREELRSLCTLQEGGRLKGNGKHSEQEGSFSALAVGEDREVVDGCNVAHSVGFVT